MARRTQLAILFLFAAALAFGSRLAQAGDLGSLAVGDSVRVRTTANTSITGTLAPSVDGFLVVTAADGLHRIPLAETSRLWRRGRSTRRGMLIGSLVGGAAVGIGVATIADDIGDGDGGVDTGLILVGATVGAGAGLLAGGLLGASFPTWHEIDTTRGRLAATGPAATAPGCPSTGRLALDLVPWAGTGDRGTRGATVTLTAQLSAYQALGLEGGLLAALVPPGDAADPAGFHDEESFFWGGLAGETALATGRVRPLLLYGVGAYQWGDAYWGYHAGAGIGATLRRGPELRLTYRHHDHFNKPPRSSPRLDMITAGAAWSW